MRAVVTGGAGFIGSNLVDHLAARGDAVLAVDDLSTGRLSNLDGARVAGVTFTEADVRDAAGLDRVLSAFRPDVIFHLAAQIDVRRSVQEPELDAAVNIGGMINVLEAARRNRVSRVVYSCTGGALYGDAELYPTPESAAIRPISPYGQSKFTAEGYLHLYGRLHGVSGVALRYANVYGPRQDPLGEGGVVSIFCDRLMTGRSPVVFGDGSQTRDYVYVEDVVRANLAVAAAPSVEGAFNVGTGRETSVLELIDVLGRVGRVTHPIQPEWAPARPGEVIRSVLDPRRIESALGWRAGVDLETGIRRTLISLSDSPDAGRSAAVQSDG